MVLATVSSCYRGAFLMRVASKVGINLVVSATVV